MFISESLAQCLRLSRINCSISITGISEMQSVMRHATQITITPAYCNESAYTTIALILRSLTKYLSNRYRVQLETRPRTRICQSWLHEFRFNRYHNWCRSIRHACSRNGVRKSSEHEPTAQNTILGWILSGSIATPTTKSISALAHHGVVLETLDRNLHRL